MIHFVLDDGSLLLSFFANLLIRLAVSASLEPLTPFMNSCFDSVLKYFAASSRYFTIDSMSRFDTSIIFSFVSSCDTYYRSSLHYLLHLELRKAGLFPLPLPRRSECADRQT